MRAGGCLVVIAQWSERWQLKPGTLGSDLSGCHFSIHLIPSNVCVPAEASCLNVFLSLPLSGQLREHFCTVIAEQTLSQPHLLSHQWRMAPQYPGPHCKSAITRQ